MHTVLQILAFCWSSSNAFVSGAESLRFKSRSGQIGHSVANGLHRCKISSKGAALPGCNDVWVQSAWVQRWGPPTRYMLLRIVEGIMKI